MAADLVGTVKSVRRLSIESRLPMLRLNVQGGGCARGRVRETIANKLINGPWDMTAQDRGNSADLYVSNVLNGTVAARGANVNRGTVVGSSCAGYVITASCRWHPRPW